MAKSLIIVESPAKARTIKKYLGDQYEVVASVGHIKDLPPNTLGIAVADGFAPQYEVIRGKRKVIQEIRKASKDAERVFLAPDPDREGEAIAWHIAEEIRSANPNIARVLFHEITKPAIIEALNQPREIDVHKFESQQARRLLDRIVGYQLSPLLWDKVRRGLSAGRVQSVAVRLVVEREREIEAFVPEEFWTVEATVTADAPPPFPLKLATRDGKKFRPKDEAEARAAEAAVQAVAAAGGLLVAAVEKKAAKRGAPPAFTTSKLQQDAARQLRMSPKRTMALAQRLYEGVNLGDEGAVGLITYMRTDSTRLSDQAVTAVRDHIAAAYGPEYLPSKPNVFKNAKRTQDAHEAIRPTSLEYPPEKLRTVLDRDELRLYTLIWNRFVACQMAPAQYDRTTVEVAAGRFGFRAQGSVLVFPGYTQVYREQREAAEEEADTTLPALAEGAALGFVGVQSAQQFTQPPPRFTEATLIKELEEQGIGRPSTYATIISTIQDKEYVRKDEGRFVPTELGRIVTELLVVSFPDILTVTFTARMEDELDEVEEGRRSWQELLQGFYTPFADTIERARSEMRDVKREETPTDLPCPQCGKHLVIRFGKKGSFLACSGYPECRLTAEYERTEEGSVRIKPAVTTDEVCPQDGAPLVLREGRFGRFLSCSNYPACRYTKPVSTGARCPREGCEGELVEKRSKRGKAFWSCSRYPACDFASWDVPKAEACPECGSPSLFVHKRRGGGEAEMKCARCSYVRVGP